MYANEQKNVLSACAKQPVSVGGADPSWDSNTDDMTREELFHAVGVLLAEIIRPGHIDAELERQVGALLAGREQMSERVRKLREYIDAHCPHSTLSEKDCQTCRFLKEDASS